MSKRGENIRKRSDGRWEGRFSVKDPVTGRRKDKSVYAGTYAEAKVKLAEMKYRLDKEAAQSTVLREKDTVLLEDVAEEWLVKTAVSKKHSTYMKYRRIYENHLAANIAGISLAAISKDGGMILKQKLNFRDVKLSDSVTKSIYSVLNQILLYCNATYQMDIRLQDVPKRAKTVKPVRPLTQSEQICLLQKLYQDMDQKNLGILLCLSTGLRLGEICALKWSDIDLQGKILYVNRTVQRIAIDRHSTKTILWEDTPKSIFSKREIPIPDNIMPYLLSMKQSTEYVISGDVPTEPRTFQYRFQKILVDAGIARHNFHILRHTFATNCINSGADIKSLSEILGHSSVHITLNRYVHPTLDTKRRHLNNLSLIYDSYMEGKKL